MIRTTLVDKFMQEHINFGGEIMTRAEVARTMQTEGFDNRAIDWWAFGRPKVSQEEFDAQIVIQV